MINMAWHQINITLMFLIVIIIINKMIAVFEAKSVRRMAEFHHPSEVFINDIEIIEHCNETSPIDIEGISEVLGTRKKMSHMSHLECFLHCLFAKYGIMDEDGGFNLGEIKNILEEALLEENTVDFLTFKCTAIDSPHKCFRAFEFTKCFWDYTATIENKDENDLLSQFQYRFKRFVIH